MRACAIHKLCINSFDKLFMKTYESKLENNPYASHKLFAQVISNALTNDYVSIFFS